MNWNENEIIKIEEYEIEIINVKKKVYKWIEIKNVRFEIMKWKENYKKRDDYRNDKMKLKMKRKYV